MKEKEKKKKSKKTKSFLPHLEEAILNVAIENNDSATEKIVFPPKGKKG